MKKVFICGYNLFGYLDSIKKGFIKAGCDVRLFCHKNVSIRKLNHRNFLKRIWTWIRLRQINDSIKKDFLNFTPDITLCINGSSIFPETASFLSQNSISVLWLVDSLERVATHKSTIAKFKKIFVFEPTDAKKIQGAEYLPYGFDEDIYFKKSIKKIYEVSFVGAGHIERYEQLNEIAWLCDSKGVRMHVFGPFTLFKKKPEYKKEYPFLFKAVVQNRRIPPTIVNEIYNQSWININIHHSQSKEGINPRTFEIAGSGNFQLVEEKKMLRMFFDEDEVITYSDIKDLVEKIVYFLRKKEQINKISEKALKKAIQKHTFTHRAIEILNRISKYF